MRVLIIGCGYVGLQLGTELVCQGHEVFGLRRNNSAFTTDLNGIIPLPGDITKPGELAALPGTYDWVVNCVSSSRGGADDYRAVYLEGTRNLIDWLSARPPKKYVYTSSTSVYAQTDGSLVTESSPTEPTEETARLLLGTEDLLLEATQKLGFPAVILRVAGIYGPQRGYWFRQYLKNEAAIEGDGLRVLNMIHRDDVAGVIIAALEKAHPGQIYNAVDDEPVTQLDFLKWLSLTLDKPLPPFVSATQSSPRKRAVTNKRVSNQRLKSDLGYTFKYPTFRQGLAAEAGV